MSLPVLAKTWQFNKNVVVPAQGSSLATSRLLMRSLKNGMIGFALMAWSVQGSSNSVAAAMDGVDRWTTDTDLVWAAGAHSWIVLRQTGIATNYEICIDLNTGTDTSATIVVSPSAGFTGGSKTARPTATDEIVIVNTSQWGSVGNFQHVLTQMQSSDGECTRNIIYYSNNCTCFAVLDKPANPVTGWSAPSLSGWTASNGTARATVAIWLKPSIGSEPVWGRHSGTNFRGTITCEWGQSNNLSELITVANQISNEWEMLPIGFVSQTATRTGRHGSYYDLWLGQTAVTDADTYPADGTMQFVQVGDFILPWNGPPTIQTA